MKMSSAGPKGEKKKKEAEKGKRENRKIYAQAVRGLLLH